MKDIITILDKRFIKYIDSENIDKAVKRLANQINTDYRGDSPMLIITLNGALVFAADLLKKLTVNCKITCIRLSSYDGLNSKNQVSDLIGLTEDLHGKRVLVVEDIIDTGNTYQYITEMLQRDGIRDYRIVTMTFKPDVYEKKLPIHYVGFKIPNKFIIGRGLDYNGYGRNLPDIYQLYEEE